MVSCWCPLSFAQQIHGMLTCCPYADLSCLYWCIVPMLMYCHSTVGGGGALSRGFVSSGLAAHMTSGIKSHAVSGGYHDSSKHADHESASVEGLVIGMCIGAMLISNFMSNVAAADIILSTLPCLAVKLSTHPLVSTLSPLGC